MTQENETPPEPTPVPVETTEEQIAHPGPAPEPEAPAEQAPAEGGETTPVDNTAAVIAEVDAKLEQPKPLPPLPPLVKNKTLYDADQAYDSYDQADVSSDEMLSRYQGILESKFAELRKAINDSKRLPGIEELTLALSLERLGESRALYNHALRDAHANTQKAAA